MLGDVIGRIPCAFLFLSTCFWSGLRYFRCGKSYKATAKILHRQIKNTAVECIRYTPQPSNHWWKKKTSHDPSVSNSPTALRIRFASALRT